jgi:hypothetical protein
MDFHQMIEHLHAFIKRCEEIESLWDGDQPGRREDDATIARELREKAEALRDSIIEYGLA